MGKRRRRSPKKSYIEVEPVNKPEPISTYRTSPDGENWVEHKGNFVVGIGGKREEDLSPEIEKAINQIVEVTKGLNNKSLNQSLINCRHKLYGIYYHFNSLNEEIDARITEADDNYEANSGAFFVIDNHLLIYETEALLFQVKSTLDILVRTLGWFVPPLKSMHSFKRETIDRKVEYGGAVIHALKSNGYPKLAKVFERNRRDWIQKLVPMRDTVSHYGKLQGFFSFMEEPYTGGKVKIHKPIMPSGVLVDEYAKDVFTKTIKLLVEAFEAALEEKKK